MQRKTEHRDAIEVVTDLAYDLPEPDVSIVTVPLEQTPERHHAYSRVAWYTLAMRLALIAVLAVSAFAQTIEWPYYGSDSGRFPLFDGEIHQYGKRSQIEAGMDI